MKKSIALVSFLACLLISVAQAETLEAPVFVATGKLQVLDAPDGKPAENTLRKGSAVTVTKQQGAWAEISTSKNVTGWVGVSDLCSGKDCWKTAAAEPGKEAKDKTVSKKEAAGKQVISSAEDTAQCPCSGADNCTGPRGGTYCITEGGKKRYR